MRRFGFVWPIIIILLCWIIFQFLVSLYPTFLWFDNLNVASVFWTNLWAKVLTGVAFGLLFFLIAAINIFVARRLTRDTKHQNREPAKDLQKMIREMFGEEAKSDEEGYVNVTPKQGVPKRSSLLWWVGIILFSLFMGFSAITQWQVVLKALNAVSFGIVDPIFGRDIGFYVFNLPLQGFLQGFIFSSLAVSLLAVAWIYFMGGGVSLQGFKLDFTKGVKAHLAIILALLSLIFAWGLWLGSLEILYSARGVIFGAGYTDVNAQLLGYNLQIFVLVVVAILFIINIFQKDYRWPIAGVGAYLIVAIVMGGIYPAIVQNLQVKPNEISMEAPYIQNAIKYTRMAYNIDNVDENKFAAEDNLTLRDIRQNSQTISNIRLWDPRPLIKTYRQLQGIRLYYDFFDVDVDRYTIDNSYQEVMLSARELKTSKLPPKAQTWVNQHVIFTHGYGACVSPVNEETPEGLPELIVKDIPPVTKTNLKIERPEIYYGEETDGYVIVNTKEKEFDYPKGDKNVYASYQGKGGVGIGSFLRRVAFAIKFSDLRILLTDYITANSRVMFERSIATRVRKIAPFLSYDRDPYVVISNGRMLWIQDAYTLSDLYPYSEPSGGRYTKFNYIRNSVKIVVDAYNGNVSFYVIDEKDPIIKTYQKIYPQLFKSFSEMPEDLVKHLRYPYDLFMIQANKYATFHMQSPQVFYNQEDLWNIPKEIYAGSEQTMDAYYIIMRLPEEKKEEFLLMLPFTPNDKDNMIAWMAGRSDVPNYGKLIVYKFPKEKLVYGPMQIEARIDQQTEISQQFTLWGQLGSSVIRGNLLAIPIDQSILYVEPVYLEASSGELPELKRVIVSYAKNVVMAETLGSALSTLFSGRVSTSTRTPVQTTSSLGLSTKALANQALKIYNQAQTGLRQGDFSVFGEKLRQLKGILQDLAR